MGKKCLFLGYDRSKTRLHDLIIDKGWDVSHTEQKVTSLSEYDLCVSFGYRFVIPEKVIKSAIRPILNLHIAYLPYNRGANPNFWSFHEGTPSGVTIHEIDKGIDTGPICFQRYVNFDRDEDTLSLTYSRLILEIDLFYESTFERDMRLVDEIQKVRTANNVNWMNLLRLGLKHNPKKTKEILNKIKSDDDKISELFKELGRSVHHNLRNRDDESNMYD